MWYGSALSKSLAQNFRTSRNRRLQKSKLRHVPPVFRRALGARRVCFHVPTTWACTLLKARPVTKSCLVYLTTPTYYFSFPFPAHPTTVRFDSHSNLIDASLWTTPHFLALFLKTLMHLFTSFLKPFLIKLKFKGKGYYVFKGTRATITPQFGFAHRRYFYSISLRVRFLSKTKIILFGFSKRDVFKSAYDFQTYKPINVFTGRGVRFAKQVLYRKTGKVSLYR